MSEKAAQSSPPPKSALDQTLAKGYMLLKGKLMKAALNELQKALKAQPQEAKTKMTQQFGRLVQQGAYEEALNLGKLLSKLEPKNYVILNHMGNCARHLKLRDLADQLYKRALHFKPDYHKAVLNLGANLAKVEWYDEEVEKEIRRQIPEFEWLLPPYQNTENLEQEVEAQLAEEGLPDTYANRLQILQLRIKNNWKNHPPDQVQQVIQGDHFNLGLCALKAGEYPRAEEVFCRLANQNSPLPQVQALCLVAHLMMDPDDQTLADCQEASQASPYDRRLHQNLGVSCFKVDQPIQGYGYLCVAADLLERSDGLYTAAEIAQRAQEYLDDEEFDLAMALYDEVCLIQERTEIRAKMAEVYRSRGDHDKALESYEKLKGNQTQDELTQSVLQEAHDAYLQMAEQALEDKKFQLALSLNQYAERINRQIETLQQKVRILSVLNRHEEEEKLREEIRYLKAQREREEDEEKRQALIIQAKRLYKAKDYLKAARILEDVLSMKKDKDVFLLLAGIYKAIKHTRSLNNLLYKWKTMADAADQEEEEAPDEETETGEQTTTEASIPEEAPQKEEKPPSQIDEILSRPQFDFELDFDL